MGYYGEFVFDVEIPVCRVHAVKAAISESQYGEEFKKDFKGDVVDLLGAYFPEADCSYDEVSALEQLALAGSDQETRGITLEGFSYQKWRGDVEDIFTIIAPFVQSGSTVFIQGEQGEKVRFLFDGTEVAYDEAAELWPEAFEPLNAAELALKKVVAVIGLTSDEKLRAAIRQVIEEHRKDLL